MWSFRPEQEGELEKRVHMQHPSILCGHERQWRCHGESKAVLGAKRMNEHCWWLITEPGSTEAGVKKIETGAENIR